MSVRWSIDGLFGRDMKSAARHFVVPALAGSGVAILEVAKTGVFEPASLLNAGIVALISFGIRFLQRFSTDTTSAV